MCKFNKCSELNFGDYVLEFSDSNYTIFLSSSSASINFIWDGVLYSEEKLLNYLDYNDNYIRQVDLLEFHMRQNLVCSQIRFPVSYLDLF